MSADDRLVTMAYSILAEHKRRIVRLWKRWMGNVRESIRARVISGEDA